MSDFNSLVNDTTDYGEGGTVVATTEVEMQQEAVSHVMQDTVLNAPNADTLAMASDTNPDELTPEPVSPTPVPPSAEPTPMGITQGEPSDPLEDFMEAHSEDFRDVSGMNLADYEEWLFKSEDEAGELAVARIVSNFKASGYEVKPTYAAVAGATWSRMNYAGEDHITALKAVERASVSSLHPLVVEIEAEGITSLIETVRKAESAAEDYRAEMITQIKADLAAEQEEAKAAESELKAENWSESMGNYAKPAAIIGATIVGLGLLKWVK
jgi:hypothetical protein